MKYAILGFNQEKIVKYIVEEDGKELRCDLTDLLLLNYIIYAQSSPKMKHLLDDDNQPCVWLHHEHILEDLPILNITSGTLKNRLTKLRKMNLITSKTIANEQAQGSRTYYRITSFLNDMLFETTSLKNDVVDEPRHSKMMSNSKLNFNNKVNKTLSKDNVTKSNPSTSFDLGIIKKDKPKKENLYSYCIGAINDFSEDKDIRSLLTQYLNLRLEMKDDKPLYKNSWKGCLNKLRRDFNEDEWKEVIQQSIDRAYGSFFPVNKFKNKNNNRPVDNIPDGIRCGNGAVEHYPDEDHTLTDLVF